MNAFQIEQVKLEAVFSNASAALAIVRGPNAIFEKVNLSYASLFNGRSLVGLSVVEALPELKGQKFPDLLAKVFATGETYVEVEATALLRRSEESPLEERYFDQSYFQIRDEKAQPYGVLIHAIDVTERVVLQRANEIKTQALELALKEAPLPAVLELIAKLIESNMGKATSASILLLDDSGHRLLHGAAPSLPSEYNDAINGIEIGPAVGACGTAAFQAAQVIAVDIATDPLWKNYRDLALKFKLRSCWSTPIVSSWGEVLGTFALYHPNTRSPSSADQQLVNLAAQTSAIVIERHQQAVRKQKVKNALRQSEARLNLALSASGIGFWDWNATTGYVFLSDTLMADWGIDPKNYGNTLPETMDRIHSEDRDRVWLEIERSTFEEKPYNVEYRVVRPSGEIIWVNAKGRYQVDEAKKPVRLTGIAINITDRRLANQALLDAVRSRDVFLSIASHELRTPLTSLKLQTQLRSRLLKKGTPTDFSPERLEKMFKSDGQQINRLARLIDDMLDISLISSGKLTLQRETFDMSALVRETAERYLPQFEALACPVTIKCDEAVEAVGDRFRLEQVVTNLLTNAIRYGNRKPVQLELKKEDDHVVFSVAD